MQLDSNTLRSFYNVSTILTILSSFYGLVLFALNSKHSQTNKTFSLFTLFVFLWSFFYFFYTNTTDPNLSLFLMRISVASAIFITPTFFHFTVLLINKFSQYKTSIIASYTYACILLATAPTPLFISGVQDIPPLTYFPLPGPTYIFLVIEYTILPLYSLFLIYKAKKEVPAGKKKELTWVFWGILFAYLGGLTEFPLSYNIPIHPIGNIFVSFYMVFITYAILKYQSFDIKLIFKRSLIYTFLITLITILYLVLTLTIEHTFRHAFGYASFFLSLIVAVAIGLLYIPTKNLLEHLIFKRSFTKMYEENQLLHQEVHQTERLKSIAILASGLAHEIKNPLTALKTFSEYLPFKIKDQQFLEKFSPIISNEVNRIDALVHELLNFAKPAPVQLKATNVHSLLDNVLDFLNTKFTKHNISVKSDYLNQPDLLLNLDANQFKQAILNILLNATDAMPSGGELLIATNFTKSHDHITIKIQDSGAGIAPEDLPNIFDPFFSKKDKGTGLGLSITHEIIKKHNGKIFVESTFGVGTIFIIELPYAS